MGSQGIFGTTYEILSTFRESFDSLEIPRDPYNSLGLPIVP